MSYPDWPGSVPGAKDQPVNPTSQHDGQPQYPPYGYQAPTGAYPGPVAPQYGAWQAQPPDYRAWVIAAVVGGLLFSLLLGMPMALLAQRSSRRVRSSWESGDANGAVKASGSARTWAIAATVFDVLGLILVIVIVSQAGHTTS
jgi:hypothetical protein